MFGMFLFLPSCSPLLSVVMDAKQKYFFSVIYVTKIVQIQLNCYIFAGRNLI